VPDEVKRPALVVPKTQARKQVIDCVDGLFEFAQAYPSMMKDGWPLNWKRYVHGLRFLGRDVARSSMSEYHITSLAMYGKQQVVENWLARQTILAGWRK
jgi:hypothetical protein